MRAAVRAMDLEPDPRTLPADPAAFVFLATLYIGPDGGQGEESFGVTVCSPEWLVGRVAEVGILDALHHVVVSVEQYNERHLRDWFDSRVRQTEGPDWQSIAQKLARLGWWEFEGYSETT